MLFTIHMIVIIFLSNNSFLDVHPLLTQYFPNATYSCDYIQSIPSTNTTIILPDWTCNDLNYTTFDFSRFTDLEYLEIGSDSFKPVSVFTIEDMNELTNLIIHNNSFTYKYFDGWIPGAIFSIKNCELLESIDIGFNSFADYSGEFELVNLPSLQSIKIGDFVNDYYYENYNFISSSFDIRGTAFCYVLFRSSQLVYY